MVKCNLFIKYLYVRNNYVGIRDMNKLEKGKIRSKLLLGNGY